MDRDEILEKARNEHKGPDERERFALARAGQVACAVGGMVCGVLILLEGFLARQVTFSTWAVYLSITGTMLLVKFLHLRRKHELVFGLLQLGLAAVFLVLHILRLVGVR